MSSTLVVAVDGPSGSGKSSTARGVATRLSLAYLDTGAMYRAVTWALLQRGTDLGDPDAIARDAADVQIVSGTDPQAPTITADGTDVSQAIREDDVTAHVSPVAAVPQVRTLLVELQRRVIASADQGIVVEGRDIGSTVAPDAAVKVYLVADAEARAARRAAERGGADQEATAASLAARDRIDSTRATSPLTRADGAVQIDGTHLSLEEVVDAVAALVEEARTA
ncbi:MULTISPECIES: (d)CMP kinase [unclassified Aeromicrobium]|uniref:(d)CMP kinase n=1 Tax=unclassified Aeromicrobium TaxID=2633570 RepID=UPI0006F4BCBC|nr:MULTISPECIES: (d)CMP kinase [unclassified Aeromicrobium]RYY46068.1 MAG: (d)CMP kinase [Actinomycetales bacterium]KQO39173.1 cytidylate kinase [Aeromicrobium sp. Leaf245]KQP28741.1 cytidylate kinase [Aeromicrobium sp. Leaf272]KQP79478.1 cytidylate kinase [Aeromicrobium sp. Leaf289]KQP82439.1 cytidylate kinase [Aeromicrobium sp. Leaf291]